MVKWHLPHMAKSNNMVVWSRRIFPTWQSQTILSFTASSFAEPLRASLALLDEHCLERFGFACNPCDPCNPCNPCNPCDPCDPCNPCNPCNPCIPCNPLHPYDHFIIPILSKRNGFLSGNARKKNLL